MPEFDLGPEEHVVLQSRKHWLLFASELLPYAIIGAIPLALPNILPLLPAANAALHLDYHDPLLRAGLGIWLLVVWTGAWGALTRYFLNVWVLTNQRIVEIQQRRFFSHEVSSLLLSRVQDVTTTVTGVLSSFIGIGTIKVQTAAEDVEFIMSGIPNPEQMRNLILKYVSTKPENGTGV